MPRVFPVEGRFLAGQPHVEHDCDDPLCIKSGAFSEDPPPQAAKAKNTKAPVTPGPSDSADKE